LVLVVQLKVVEVLHLSDQNQLQVDRVLLAMVVRTHGQLPHLTDQSYTKMVMDHHQTEMLVVLVVVRQATAVLHHHPCVVELEQQEELVSKQISLDQLLLPSCHLIS
tara:strand:- start:295 stop:615 length:321 start_codon:yes stop_codon:yes gene_type:complete